MKYITDTLKYLKSNLLLLPALAVAMAAFAIIIDFDAAERVAQSYSNGVLQASLTDWIRLFVPFNTENWLTGLLSVVAYAALIFDVAFVHSMVDKHIRFGSKSFRSIISSLTINCVYGCVFTLVLAAACTLLGLVAAVVMRAFSLAPAYVFIAGAALCSLLGAFAVFVAAHIALWLPCSEITGYKMGEAFYCSYAQARTVRWKIFFALIIPLAAVGAAAIDFNKAFILFHKVFFNNDMWMFDPAADPIIEILPEAFFMHCAMVIAAFYLAAAVFQLVLSRRKSHG